MAGATRLLDRVERVGNRMPSPAVLFLLLCVLTIVLSQVLFWFNVRATNETVTPQPVPTIETYYGGSVEPGYVGPTQPEPADAYKLHTVTVKVQGLLTADGVRYLFTSFVSNLRDFAPLAIILVVMVGVGLAEAAGLIGALVRRLVAISSASMLTPIILLLGVISSIASDAGTSCSSRLGRRPSRVSAGTPWRVSRPRSPASPRASGSTS